jgi:capsular exopolysaccharide synthesis family protein
MNELTFRPAVPGQRPDPSPDAVVGERVSNSQVLILRYINIAKRWKWLLIGTVVVAAIIGLVITLLMTPLYTASTTLEVQRESERIVNVQGLEPENAAFDQEFYDTQWGLLKSQTLAERVAAELRLHENAAFFEMFGATSYAEMLQARSAGGAAASQRQELLRAAALILLDNVEIAPERRSRLVAILFTSPDPALSQRVANTWGEAFIETSLERRFEATSYARTYLEERLDQLRERLQQSERDLVAYAASQRIINVPTSTTTGTGPGATVERPLVAEDLSTLNQELNKAVAARIEAQTRLRGNGSAAPEYVDNQTISELRTRRAALAGDYARLTAEFEPEYPPARAMADQLAEIDRAITREEQRTRSVVQNMYSAAAERENVLRQRVNQLETQLLDLRGRTIQYNIFQREVDTNRELYDALLQRYKEIGVAGGVGVNNISIVDPAQLPEAPSSPNLILNLLVSILLGGAIGAGLALALEQIDETISDPRDLESSLGLPLIGTIPRSDEENPREELEDPKTPMVEAYLSALTRLAFTTEHGVPLTVAVTSARPSEGKSTTAYALARQLSRTSRRVILVDGDMRSPSLHQMFGLPNERGLSNYLSGDDDLGAMIHAQPNKPAILLAGPMPPNAAELLTGDRIAKLLRELSSRFEHVIIDAPPVMGLADTPLIASMVEGVIFVVESHGTRTSLARVAVGRLRDSKARILGALLTKFQAQKAHYGYGYEYGYGYGDRDGRDAAAD